MKSKYKLHKPELIIYQLTIITRQVSNKYLLSFFIWILMILGLKAQNVSVHGSFGASTEFYQFNSEDSTLRPRRPDFNYRLFFSPVIQFGNNFTLPFTFELTKQFKEAYLPLPPSDNLIRSFANPNNAIGIHPTLSWAKFHLGSHTAEYSELSTGNVPIFGAGFDLQPGHFRIAYSYGVSQWAITPDTTLQLDGSYERRFQATKIGFGQKDGSGVYLNAVKIRDVTDDFENHLPKTTAKEGILATIDFRIKLSEHYSLNGEVGGSAFTDNLLSEELEGDWISDLPEFIFNPRESTRTDYAGSANFDIDYTKWGMNFQAKYLGAGFESLGFAYLETDVLDLIIAPRFRLFNNHFILNASVGQRQDNLSNTKTTTTRRFIGNGSITVVVSNSLTVSANYSNYGTRNTIDNDTLRLEFVSQNFSVSPSYRFKIGKVANTLSASIASSQFDDKNLFSGERNSNDMKAVTGNWTAIIGKLTFSAVGSISRNERSTGVIDIQTWSFQPGISLYKRKVQISCGFVYSQIEQTGSTADTRMMLRPNVRWKVTNRLQFRADANLTTYQYGSARNDSQYDESYLQTGIVQSF